MDLFRVPVDGLSVSTKNGMDQTVGVNAGGLGYFLASQDPGVFVVSRAASLKSLLQERVVHSKRGAFAMRLPVLVAKAIGTLISMHPSDPRLLEKAPRSRMAP